jgi:hypothetical protein
LKYKKALTIKLFLLLILIVFLNGCGDESMSDGTGDQADTDDATPPLITLPG